MSWCLSASGSHADDSWAGATLNAADPGRKPGGSSAGTATAVAASLAVLGLAEETGCRSRTRPRPGAGRGQAELRPGAQCRRHAAGRQHPRRRRPDRALRARRGADARRAGRLQPGGPQDRGRDRAQAAGPAVCRRPRRRHRCAASASACTGRDGAASRCRPRWPRLPAGDRGAGGAGRGPGRGSVRRVRLRRHRPPAADRRRGTTRAAAKVCPTTWTAT